MEDPQRNCWEKIELSEEDEYVKIPLSFFAYHVTGVLNNLHKSYFPDFTLQMEMLNFWVTENFNN